MHLLFVTTLIAALASSQTFDAPPPLHVVGAALRTPAGKEVLLRGVNVASMEWTATGENVIQSVRVAIEDWHANVIRLPLCQDRWFGKTEGQNDGGAAYRERVREVVREASRRGAYILLDLHWSDAGEWGRHVGQHKMPDENSVAFWKSCAAAFANHPAVLFDLYNEPYGVTWKIWRDGGEVTENDRGATLRYQAVGLQTLLDTVRAAGARNPVVAGGLDWAYDLTGIVQGYALHDPHGAGVIYSTHIYPWKKDWDRFVGPAIGRYPVLVGEAGCSPDARQEDPKTWAPRLLDYVRKNRLNFTAWDLHPAAGPCLIKDWNYAPTPYWGEYVKAFLAEKPNP
ncbi:MAG: glycoside hydrolase family 5 protein [Chthonomonadales bacterium]